MAGHTTKLDAVTVGGLHPGETTTIVGISGGHTYAKRLADMGFVAGTRIRMIRRGNPCIVRIGGTFVGLGAANQTCVLVERPTRGEF